MTGSNHKVQLKLDESVDAVIMRGGLTVEFNRDGVVVRSNGLNSAVIVRDTREDSAVEAEPPVANENPVRRDTLERKRIVDIMSGAIKYTGISPDTGTARTKTGYVPHRRWYPLRRPQIGDEMPDGTICAGISPDTGRPTPRPPMRLLQ